MIQTFNCPSCHASLDHNTDETTVRCPFCNTTVIVPEELRQNAAQQKGAVNVFTSNSMGALLQVTQLARRGRTEEAARLYQSAFQVSYPEAQRIVAQMAGGASMSSGGPAITEVSGGRTGCWVVAIMALVVVIIVGAVGAFFFTALATPTVSVPSPNLDPQISLAGTAAPAASPTPLPNTPTPAPTATPAFASLTLQFGGEGTGPGKFDDTRTVAVDGQGTIYAADYSDGRVQLFDPTGKFITTYTLGDDIYMPQMFVSRDGQTLYAMHSGNIWRYNAQTGEALGTLLAQPRDLRDMAPTIDSGFVTLHYQGVDDVITRYNAQGEVVATFNNLGQNYDNDKQVKRVIMGNDFDLYLLVDEDVLHFNAAGTLIDKVSSDGQDDETQYSAATALAVDTSGRLYVNGPDNIKVYDGDGRYIATITYAEPITYVFNIMISPENKLYAMDRNGNQLLRFDLP